MTVSVFRCQAQYLQAARLDLEDLEALETLLVPKDKVIITISMKRRMYFEMLSKHIKSVKF